MWSRPIAQTWLITATLSLMAGCNPPKAEHGDGVSILGSYEDGSLNLVFAEKKRADAKISGREVFADEQFRIASLREHATIQGNQADLYYASFSNPAVLISLESYGKILYRGKDRAVMKITNIEHVEAASAILHTIGGLNCGGLQRVLLDELVPVQSTRRLSLTDNQLSTSTAVPAVAQMTQKVSAEGIRATINQLVSLGSRHYRSPSGVQATNLVAEAYKRLANGRADVEVGGFQHRDYQQQTVIARIKGMTNPEKIVVIGSHLDSINHSGGGVSAQAPGADDNASGTATLIDAFRVLMESGARFKYTVEFHAYAAEEPGLLGSQDVATRYRSERKEVISMVQIDMNGYIASGGPRKMWLVSNNTNAALNTALGQLIDTYIKVPWGQKALTAGSSDHASWTRTGIPAAFPFEDPANDNPNIHTARDTIDRLDTTYSALYGQLVIAYASHYAQIEGAGTPVAAQPIALRVANGAAAGSVLLAAGVDASSGIEQLTLCDGDAVACKAPNAPVALPFAAGTVSGSRRVFMASRDLQAINDKVISLVGRTKNGAIVLVRSVKLKQK